MQCYEKKAINSSSRMLCNGTPITQPVALGVLCPFHQVSALISSQRKLLSAGYPW